MGPRVTSALKIIGWMAGVLVALALLLGGALWLGGAPAVAWAIEHPVSGMLGREIRIAGPLRIVWGAPAEIVAEDVSVANAPWGSDKEMLRAKRLEADVFLGSLVFGTPRIPRIAIDGAKLLLETSPQGQKNWDFGPAGKSSAQVPDLQRLDIRGSELIYRNGATGGTSDLEVKTLALAESDPASPVRIDADGTFEKAPLQLAGSVGPPAELRHPSKPYPVKLEGRLDQVRLAVDGTIRAPLDAQGMALRLSLSGAKFDEAMGLFGVPFPEIPDFRGTSELSGGDGRFSLKAISLKMGRSDLEGGIDIETRAKVPAFKLQLSSRFIDLASFKGLIGGKPEGSSAPEPPPSTDGRLLPSTPIAAHKLPGFDVDLAFDATRIEQAGGIAIDRIALGLRLKDDQLMVKPLRFHTAKGDVDLNFRFTPFTRDTPPKLHAEIDVRHVDLRQLLGGPTMPPMVRETAGTVGGFVKLDTTGISVREFAAHMNGDAGFFMEDGQVSQLLERLAPIDVLSALGVYLSGDKPVRINCLVSRFDVKQGVATATTLIADTESDTIAGKGDVNFADEGLYLDLHPENKHFTAVSLRTPVEIRGTFAKPEFHLETGKLMQRLGAALGLAVTVPPAALLPLIDTGLGEQNACAKAFAAQQPPGNPQARSGSSEPGKKP